MEYRFPPTIYWIIGGGGLVYGLFLLVKNIKDNKVLCLIQKIGQNTLSYLVISNLLIFMVNRLEISLGLFIDTLDLRIMVYILLFVVSISLGYVYNCFIGRVKKLN